MTSRRGAYVSLRRPRPSGVVQNRSHDAVERQRLYRTQRWLRLRRLQLKMHPLCRLCELEGKLTIAVVADHRDGHTGDWRGRFYDLAALQSLCLEHHGEKSALEGVAKRDEDTHSGCRPDMKLR